MAILSTAGAPALPINRAIFLGQNVWNAEQVVTSSQLPYPIPAGYHLLFTFEGNDLITDFDKSNHDDALIPTIFLPFGFVAAADVPSDNGTTDVFVAIRGTETIWEWLQDAYFLQKPFPFAPGVGNTEDGFTDMYESLTVASAAGGSTRLAPAIAEAIAAIPKPAVTVAGHSLGAALATLLGYELAATPGVPNPTVFTFASPYVGDSDFAERFNTLVPNSWRIANLVDIVTHVPSGVLFRYVHVNTLNQLNFLGKVTFGPVCFHALKSYLHFLSIETSGAITIDLDSDCQPKGLFGL